MDIWCNSETQNSERRTQNPGFLSRRCGACALSFQFCVLRSAFCVPSFFLSDFDVAVIGAGPAGSWAAYKLATSGARVALVDGTHPREKPCGGGVTARAFDLVRDAVTPASVQTVTVNTVTFGAGAETAVVPLDHHARILVAARREFDSALRNAAIAAGAQPISAQVSDVEPATSGWSIRLRTRGFTADWLLGADGANSLVRRRVWRPFGRADLSIATGYFVEDAALSEIRIAFERDPPGYLWSFPRPDHLAVGICAQADASSSRSLLQRAAAWMTRDLPAARGVARRYSWPIPSLDERGFRRERLGGCNWMLLGDAAGLVDPITREGIYFALISADEAAAALMTAPDVADAYGRRIRALVHDELIRAARLKAMFFRPKFTSLLVSALQRSDAVRRVMADLIGGRQTYRGLRRRLLATCDLQLMIRLLRG